MEQVNASLIARGLIHGDRMPLITMFSDCEELDDVRSTSCMQGKLRGGFYSFQLCDVDMKAVAPADRLLRDAVLESGELEKHVQRVKELELREKKADAERERERKKEANAKSQRERERKNAKAKRESEERKRDTEAKGRHEELEEKKIEEEARAKRELEEAKRERKEKRREEKARAKREIEEAERERKEKRREEKAKAKLEFEKKIEEEVRATQSQNGVIRIGLRRMRDHLAAMHLTMEILLVSLDDGVVQAEASASAEVEAHSGTEGVAACALE
ncbi:uncharacterized protein ACA1_156860 [Acanthamoeba castellanii str. Neff]|uniref:Uncharacterized protein n=1 Tax=Acanthamoeba castellanii (strain ATCC 30010 / Neff) TaxID=1257118 RepID=L8GIG2_ACACF|nr:uncharacterized protein ACA1_156860 [Acanthamoeba castellanii str. Neff]ELR12543.1 hypothetical protein ACA1_156860 [Acanthamoeba castellanii str. Neff]